MEPKDFKTCSIIFGSISFVVTVSGLHTFYQLGKVLASPKLTYSSVDSSYNGRYVSLTGVASSSSSFQSSTEKQEKVLFSRVKTTYDIIGPISKKFYDKKINFTEFCIKGENNVNVLPAYHSVIKAPVIHDEFIQHVSRSQYFLYKLSYIFLFPFYSLFGITVKLGENVKEKAIKTGTFLTVCGVLQKRSEGLTIIPDYISLSLSEIYSYLLKRSALIIVFQTIFTGLAFWFWHKGKKREKELRESKKIIKGDNKALKCKNCEKVCDVYFEPCLEIVLCNECSQKAENCPKCNSQIEKKINLHLA